MNTFSSKNKVAQFFSSQYLYSGVRISFAIIIPSIILAYFGVLKQYFIFPLGTSFVAYTDMVGPYHRRRNALALSCILFPLIALIGGFFRENIIIVFFQIIFWGVFLTMIGIYGLRLASVGGLGLVVLSIFIDGKLASGHLFSSVGILFLGCVWYLIVFMLVNRLRPYKLAQQMIGENYFHLSEYLKIKAKFYDENQEYSVLKKELLSKQIIIKNLQEETREVVFKTRKIVNESTTTSRLLMFSFLNSIDFYEKIFTTDHDYKTLHSFFRKDGMMREIYHHLEKMAQEISLIGIGIQRNFQQKQKIDLQKSYNELLLKLNEIESYKLNDENSHYFKKMRHILSRINDATQDILMIYKFHNQDISLVQSLSTGLDYSKFVTSTEKLNYKVFFSNFSLKSFHFRYAIRMAIALLLGYGISIIPALNIGYPYWILITIVAIMRPAFSTTKGRNLLRIYGTIGGGVVSYCLLSWVTSPVALLVILLLSMILCFSFLKDNYSWAVFFMTIYIFITFNFMAPGNINTLFKDRLIDTFLAGAIVFLVSYLVFPIWESSVSLNLMKSSTVANYNYFNVVMGRLVGNSSISEEEYKLKRKEAIICLANLSDSFQRMLSDPQNQRQKMEYLHQFVNTTHLITEYIASISQNKVNNILKEDKEISNLILDIEKDFNDINNFFNRENRQIIAKQSREIGIDFQVDVESFQNDDFRNIKDIMLLLKSVVEEQRKLVERHEKDILN